MHPNRLAALFALGSAALIAQVPEPPAPPEPPMPPEPPTGGLEGYGNVRTEKRLEKLAYGSKLWVKNRNGAIKVVGWDREEVSLTAQIRDTEKRKIDLVIQHKGADLDIEAVFQQPSFSFNFGFVRSPFCEMTLQVPKKVLAFFRTVNGRVNASNMEGYTRCETTNGSVTLADLKGEVLAETTNGSIDARRLSARLKAGTTNGKIVVEQVEGGLKLETTNGSIYARNLDGWGEGILMETTNGKIEVELGKASGEVKVENTHGDLDIHLPGAQVIELGKHSAHLKVPGKHQLIRLETTNGSVHLK